LAVVVELARRLLHVLFGDEGPVAVSQEHRGERDVHVHVGVADAELLRCLVRHLAVLEDADDREPDVADLDRFADRLFGGEEARLDAVADDRDGRAVGHLHRGEALALGHVEVEEVEVGGVDADDLTGAATAFARNERLVDDLAAGGIDVRHHAHDRLRIALGEAGRELLRLLRSLVLRLLLLLLHERRHDHVVGAEELHLLEDLRFGPLADREHRDDGRDAEQNAQ
jgi:hypothetical protein